MYRRPSSTSHRVNMLCGKSFRHASVMPRHVVALDDDVTFPQSMCRAELLSLRRSPRVPGSLQGRQPVLQPGGRQLLPRSSAGRRTGVVDPSTGCRWSARGQFSHPVDLARNQRRAGPARADGMRTGPAEPEALQRRRITTAHRHGPHEQELIQRQLAV
jgi:hypothetical protein